ncbi:MAG: hypothetical protein ABW352_21930 [Polyangiales bacterium]
MGVLALGGLAMVGCIIDEHRCDAHQVEVPGHDFALCVCEPNAIFNADGAGCTPCGLNELALNGACVCADGFAKETTGGSCTPSTVGAACNASTPCTAAFPYCVSSGAGDGYCSKQGCTANADCPSEYTCESNDAGRFCRRPPSGFGVSCASDADCAGFEANACETLQTKTCILQGCAQKQATCPSEWACCDYSALQSILGRLFSVCAPPSMLMSGSCPAPGVRVTP